MATIGTVVFAFLNLLLSQAPLLRVPASWLQCSPHLDPAVCTEMCLKKPGFVEDVQEEGGMATDRSLGRNQPWAPLTAHAS